MNRVAPEFAVEIVVHFEQCDLHPSPGQEQREQRTGGSASNDAAAARFILLSLSLGGSLENLNRCHRCFFTRGAQIIVISRALPTEPCPSASATVGDYPTCVPHINLTVFRTLKERVSPRMFNRPTWRHGEGLSGQVRTPPGVAYSDLPLQHESLLATESLLFGASCQVSHVESGIGPVWFGNNRAEWPRIKLADIRAWVQARNTPAHSNGERNG